MYYKFFLDIFVWFFKSKVSIETESIIIAELEPYFKRCYLHNPTLKENKHWQQLKIKKANRWYNLFSYLLKKVDAVAFWGGLSPIYKMAKLVATETGKKVFFFENGVLPGTIVIDHKGTNNESSLKDIDPQFLSGLFDKDQFSSLKETIFPQRPLRKIKNKSKGVAVQDPSIESFPEDYILFIMQVHDDSQIVNFSPYFENMTESIEYVYTNMEQYNEKYKTDYKLVVKEHPSDYGRINYEDFYAKYPDIIVIRTIPVRKLFDSAKILITVNSSVAVEAMIYGLPIITLGNAFFNKPGLCCFFNPAEENMVDILKFDCLNFDQKLRDNYISFLFYDFLLKIPSVDNLFAAELAANRISELLNDIHLVENILKEREQLVLAKI